MLSNIITIWVGSLTVLSLLPIALDKLGMVIDLRVVDYYKTETSDTDYDYGETNPSFPDRSKIPVKRKNECSQTEVMLMDDRKNFDRLLVWLFRVAFIFISIALVGRFVENIVKSLNWFDTLIDVCCFSITIPSVWIFDFILISLVTICLSLLFVCVMLFLNSIMRTTNTDTASGISNDIANLTSRNPESKNDQNSLYL